MHSRYRTETDYVSTQIISAYNTWLGLTDIVTEGTFEWFSGCTSSFTNWGDGESGDYAGFGGEDCAAIRGNH